MNIIENTRILMSYDSITYRLEYYIDDNLPERCIKIIKKNKNIEISEWFDYFLVAYLEEKNDSNIEIEFESSVYDIELVNDIVKAVNIKNNCDFRIKGKEKEFAINDKLKKIIAFIEEVEKHGDKNVIEAFRERNVFEQLDEIKKAEVSIVVAATMSAGKSTLINAFIGKDLLPSKNEACTATICKIKDINGKIDFDATVKDEKGQTKEYIKNISKKRLEEINEKGNKEYFEIYIEGDIEGVLSNDLNMVLIDTPGPNNSKSMRHKEVTYSYLKDNENKPLILYVLNMAQARTTDDKIFLTEISEIIETRGQDTLERIIFVLNRIDEINPEKEQLSDVIERFKGYLSQFGVKNPKIFPVSAELAKLAVLKEEELSYTEESDLINLKRKILPNLKKNYKGIDTIRYSAILEKEKVQLKEESLYDEEKAILNYSGISALKIYINDYVNRTHKIKFLNKLINAILPVLEKLESEIRLAKNDTNSDIHDLNETIKGFRNDLEFNTVEKVKKNKRQIKEEVERLKLTIEKKELELEKENKIYKDDLNTFLKIQTRFKKEIPKIENEIRSLPVSDRVLNFQRAKVKKRVDKILDKCFAEASNVGAKEFVLYAKSIIDELGVSLKTSIDSELEFIVNQTSKRVKNIIEGSFQDIISNVNFGERKSMVYDFNSLRRIDLHNYKREKTVKTGEEEVSTSTWYLPFTWGDTEIKNIYGKELVYDLVDIYNKDISPEIKRFYTLISEVKEDFDAQIKAVKNESADFIKRIEANLEEEKEKMKKRSIEKEKKSRDFLKMSERNKNQIERHLGNDEVLDEQMVKIADCKASIAKTLKEMEELKQERDMHRDSCIVIKSKREQLKFIIE